MKDYQPGLLENGGKFVLLFNLIQESLAMEDKILVFRYVTVPFSFIIYIIQYLSKIFGHLNSLP